MRAVRTTAFGRPARSGCVIGWLRVISGAALVVTVLWSLPWLRLLLAYGLYELGVAITVWHLPNIVPSAWFGPQRSRWIDHHPQLNVSTAIATWVLLGLVVVAVITWLRNRWWYRPTDSQGSARWPTRWECLRLWRGPTVPSVSALGLTVIQRVAPRQKGVRRAAWIVATERRLRVRRARARPRASIFELGRYQGMWLALQARHLWEHVFIVGPPGEGKSQRYIIPAILREWGQRAFVAFDLKGELRAITEPTIRQRMPTWVLDPRDPTARHFNPLKHIHDEQTAYRFAKLWFDLAGRGKPPWDAYAEDVVAMLIIHLRATEPDAPFSKLIDALTTITFNQMKGLITRSPVAWVREHGKAWLDNTGGNAEQVSSILSNVQRGFLRYATPLVHDLTASDEMPLADLATTPIGCYICISDTDSDALKPIVAFLFDRLFVTLQSAADTCPGRHLPHGVAIYLDEFANIGAIPEFPQFLTKARSRWIGLVLAFQSFAQLEAVYGKTIQSVITDVCKTKILLRHSGERERKYFSEILGITTVLMPSYNSTATGRGIGVREGRRQLQTTDELYSMETDEAIVITGWARGMRVQVPPAYARLAFRQVAALRHTP